MVSTTTQRAVALQLERKDGRRWKSVEIPIPAAQWPVLTARFPMPQKEWDEFMELLELMKPALIGSD